MIEFSLPNFLQLFLSELKFVKADDLSEAIRQKNISAIREMAGGHVEIIKEIALSNFDIDQLAQKILAQVRRQAGDLKSELYRLYTSTPTSVIGDDLKTKLYNGGLSYIPADLGSLSNWVTQWTPVLSEVRQVLAQKEASRNSREEKPVVSSTVRTPSARRERDQRRKPPTESGSVFGQGSDAWGALDNLKF